MKRTYFYLLCFAGIQLISAGIVTAQKNTLALKSPAGNVIIDGNAREWGDTLSYYNIDKKIHYTLANDKTNLYLVIKTNDPTQENNILNAGVTFSVDTKGRKRSAYSTTFPFADAGSPRFTGQGTETQQQKSIKARLTKLKKIGVDGFKDINDDAVGINNTYGIQAAIDYDEQGNLVYEEVIPLALFHAGDLAKGEWSFNIKLNGAGFHSNVTSKIVAVPAGSASSPTVTSGLVGVPAGSSPTGNSGRFASPGSTGSANFPPADAAPERIPSIDFWGKFTLANFQ